MKFKISFVMLVFLMVGSVSAFSYSSNIAEDDSGIVFYSTSIMSFLDRLNGREIDGSVFYGSSLNKDIVEDFSAVFYLYPTTTLNDSLGGDSRIIIGTVNSSFVDSNVSSFLLGVDYDAVVLYEENDLLELSIVLKNENVLPFILDDLKFYSNFNGLIENVAFYSIENKFFTTSNYVECDTPETDFGFDPNFKGCFNDSFFGEICDFCDSPTDLIESSCEGGIALFYRHECETGCVSGSGRCESDCIDGTYTNIYKCSNENGAAVWDYGKKVVQRKMRGKSSTGECRYQWVQPDFRDYIVNASLGSPDGSCLYGCQGGECLASGICQEGKIFGSESCSGGFLSWLEGSYSETEGCQAEQKFESCRLGCQDVEGVDRCLTIEDTCPEEVIEYSCKSDGRTLMVTDQYIHRGSYGSSECRTRTNPTEVVCQFGCVDEGIDARCRRAGESEYKCEGLRLMKKQRSCPTCDWETLEICGFGCDVGKGICTQRICGPTEYCMLPKPACKEGEFCWGSTMNYSEYLKLVARRPIVSASGGTVPTEIIRTADVPETARSVQAGERVIIKCLGSYLVKRETIGGSDWWVRDQFCETGCDTQKRECKPEVNGENCKEKWHDSFECDGKVLQQRHTFIKKTFNRDTDDYDLSCVNELEKVRVLRSSKSCEAVRKSDAKLKKYGEEVGCPDFWWGNSKRYFAEFKCEGRVLYQKFSGGASCGSEEDWDKIKSFVRARSCETVLKNPAKLAKYDKPVGCPMIWKNNYKCEGKVLYQNYTGGSECSTDGQWAKVKTLKSSASCGRVLAANPAKYGRGLSSKNQETYTRWAGVMGFVVSDLEVKDSNKGRLPDWKDDVYDWFYNI